MGQFAELEFEDVPVREPGAASVKVSVLKSDALRVTLNAPAFEKLGEPDALAVQAATRDGRAFLRCLVADEGKGWPVTIRTVGERSPSGSCSITAHPFKPGVTHQAMECDVEWIDEAPGGGRGFILTLPDWADILSKVEAAE